MHELWTEIQMLENSPDTESKDVEGDAQDADGLGCVKGESSVMESTAEYR